MKQVFKLYLLLFLRYISFPFPTFARKAIYSHSKLELLTKHVLYLTIGT